MYLLSVGRHFEDCGMRNSDSFDVLPSFKGRRERNICRDEGLKFIFSQLATFSFWFDWEISHRSQMEIITE